MAETLHLLALTQCQMAASQISLVRFQLAPGILDVYLPLAPLPVTLTCAVERVPMVVQQARALIHAPKMLIHKAKFARYAIQLQLLQLLTQLLAQLSRIRAAIHTSSV